MSKRLTLRTWLVVGVLLATLSVAAMAEAGDRPLTFEELMKFRQIRDAVISEDGQWVAYALVPDRGDQEVVVRSTSNDSAFRIERGSGPVISADGRWVAAAITPTLEEREKARAKKGSNGGDDNDEKPKEGLSLLDLQTGVEERFEKVKTFSFSEGGRWLAAKHHQEKKESDKDLDSATEGEEKDNDKKKKEKELGTTLKLRDLTSGELLAIEYVSDFSFSEQAPILVYAVSAPEGEGNGVFAKILDRPGSDDVALHQVKNGKYTHLEWAREANHLAFVAAVFDDEGEAGDGEVWVWRGQGEVAKAASRDDAPEGWTIPSTNELQWSRDGQRLFFGFKPISEDVEKDDGSDGDDPPFDPFDFEALLDKRELDVWHWNDPRIIPNQKERWEEHEKDRVYRAVFHLQSGLVVPLADLEMPEIEPADNPRSVLGGSDLPYLKELTWDGRYADLFVVDLKRGVRHAGYESSGGRPLSEPLTVSRRALCDLLRRRELVSVPRRRQDARKSDCGPRRQLR
jgi:hypothetical protein